MYFNNCIKSQLILGGIIYFQLESDGVEGGIARDTDALTILDNRKTRNLILNDLHELVNFFVLLIDTFLDFFKQWF